MLVKAPPIMIPTAMSITLPLLINFLNSSKNFFIEDSSLSIKIYHNNGIQLYYITNAVKW
jgi:hypothetical protein